MEWAMALVRHGRGSLSLLVKRSREMKGWVGKIFGVLHVSELGPILISVIFPPVLYIQIKSNCLL